MGETPPRPTSFHLSPHRLDSEFPRSDAGPSSVGRREPSRVPVGPAQQQMWGAGRQTNYPPPSRLTGTVLGKEVVSGGVTGGQ